MPPGAGAADAAPSTSRLAFAYPPTSSSAVLIEFPGYIRNPAVALAVLGGEKVREKRQGKTYFFWGK